MSNNASDANTFINRFDEVAELFSQQLRRGDCPDIEEFVSKYPRLENKIRQLFPVLQIMESDGSCPDEWHNLESIESYLNEHVDNPAGLELGDFRVVREIGRGGMGVVYLAEQKSLGRNVALKLLPDSVQFDSRRKLRFQQEARASAMLHHTNIVPIFDIGQHDNISYFVMQLIDGYSLSAVLNEISKERSKTKPAQSTKKNLKAEISTVATSLLSSVNEPVNEEAITTISRKETSRKKFRVDAPVDVSMSKDYHRNVARIGLQVALALDHAHSKGILHRDIKPSNLLVNKDGDVWVTDFGLAKTFGSPDLTRTGEIVGTLRYMSPEQMNGNPDERSDIFGLGLTLYEMLALKPAYDAEERQLLVQQIVDASPRNVESADGTVPRDLATIVNKCIRTDPDKRYQTADELAADLRRYLDGRPVLARRVGIIGKLAHWCSRRPLVASLIAGLVISLGAGIWGVSSQLKKTAAALHISKINEDEALKQSELSLRTLSDVVCDFSQVLKQYETQVATQEVASGTRRKMYQRVLDGLRHVSEDVRDRQRYSKVLIWTHLDLAKAFLLLGNEDFSNGINAANAEFELAREKVEKWVESEPHNRSALQVYAEVLQDIGMARFTEQQFSLARELVTKSIAIEEKTMSIFTDDWDEISEQIPDDEKFKDGLADYFNENFSAPNRAKFEHEFERTIRRPWDDLQAVRSSIFGRRRLIIRHALLALIEFRSFQLDDACKTYQRVLDLKEELCEQYSPMYLGELEKRTIPESRTNLFICSNLPKVRDDLDVAFEFEEAMTPRLLYDCAAWHAFEGDHASASLALERMDEIDSLGASHYYNNACGWGRCLNALLDERSVDSLDGKDTELFFKYESKAMKSLQKAEAAGTFEDKSMIALLARDHDLDALRASKDFSSFFEGLVTEE